jgi:hypothetical protein
MVVVVLDKNRFIRLSVELAARYNVLYDSLFSRVLLDRWVDRRTLLLRNRSGDVNVA